MKWVYTIFFLAIATVAIAVTTYIGNFRTSSGDVQAQIDTITSTFGDAIGTGLTLDSTTLKASPNLQEYNSVNPSAFALTAFDDADAATFRTTIGALGADEKFTMGATIQETSSSDTTPDVSNAATGLNNIYRSNANGTITDFDDSDDHSEFSDGDWFPFICDDSSTILNFNSNSNLIRPGNQDYTCSDTQPTVIIFYYLDAAWHTDSLAPGVTSPTTFAIKSISISTYAHFSGADAAYNDTSTPHDLISAETHGGIITNCGATEDRVYTLHAYDFGMNFSVMVCAAYQMDLEPPSGGLINLNGTDASADEHIINAADTEGDLMSCWSVEVSDGTYKLYCKSDNSNWAEASP